MFATEFSFVRLPEPYGEGLKRTVDMDYKIAVEMVAWLEGKEASIEAVKEGLLYCEYKTISERIHNACNPIPSIKETFAERLCKVHPIPPIKETLDLTIVTSDGKEVLASSSRLSRLFHRFSGDERRVEVPYKEDVIRGVLDMTRELYSLASHLDCLRYFSPRDPIRYFTFDTIGTSKDDILAISSLLSKEQKESITDMAKFGGFEDVPQSQVSEPFLSFIFRYRHDWDSLMAFYPDCPAYLACTLSSWCYRSDTQGDLAKRHFDHLISTRDFSKSIETCESRYDAQLAQSILASIERMTTWEEVRKRVLMLGYRSPLFLTEGKVYMPPYKMPIDGKYQLQPVGEASLAKVISRWLGITREEALKSLRE